MASVREGLLGPSYLYHRRLIERSKSWTSDEVHLYQERQVERLMRRYGDRVTSRQDYRENLQHFSRWDVAPFTRSVRTGGTSGQPLSFKADRFARRQKERAYLFDIWSQVNYAPYDLRVVFRGNIHRRVVRFDPLENAWVVSPTIGTDEELSGLRSWMQTLPTFFLHVYPGSLYMFMDLMGEAAFRSLPIRGVLAGSEAFPAGELARFEQEFDIRVAHWYGHTEYAVLAYLCRECGGFHFYPTYGRVEFLPSDIDEVKRIVASSFNRIGTQFVRYDTGDVALTAHGSCTDGFPRAGAIIGRSQETFIDSAGRKRALGSYVFGIHGSFWDQIRDLQFFQDRPGRLGVRIVPTARANRLETQETLKLRLPMVELEFEYVSRIERHANGKRAYFVDYLS